MSYAVSERRRRIAAIPEVRARRETQVQRILEWERTPGWKGAASEFAVLIGKKFAVIAVAFHTIFFGYDATTQLTPVQKKTWDVTIWNNNVGPRHAVRDEGEGITAKELAQSRAWRGMKEFVNKHSVLASIGKGAKWFINNVVGAPAAILMAIARTPTLDHMQRSNTPLTRGQTYRLRTIQVTGVVGGAIGGYFAWHHGIAPQISAHHAAITKAANSLSGSASHLGKAAGAHLGHTKIGSKVVSKIGPSILQDPAGYIRALPSNIAANLAGNTWANKAIGFAGTFTVRVPSLILSESRQRRIAADIFDGYRSYRPWMYNPIKRAVQRHAVEVAEGRASARTAVGTRHARAMQAKLAQTAATAGVAAA